MQLNSDLSVTGRRYGFAPRGRMWAVYLYTSYRRAGDPAQSVFTMGDKVSEHPTREEAWREAYRLNRCLRGERRKI